MLDNEIFLVEQLTEEANQKALLLAQERFNREVRAFISGKPDRLAYVKKDIDQIIVEAAAEARADVEYVSSRFLPYVAEAVAVSEPDHMELEVAENEGMPPAKNDPLKKNPEPDAETSVLDHEIVLEDEITEPDAKIDLNENTQKSTSCYRCDKELNPVVANVSKVCVECASELSKLGDGLAPLGPSPAGQGQNMSPADPNAQVQCNLCAAKGYHFEGTPQEVEQHIQTQHQSDLRTQQQQTMQNGGVVPTPGVVGKIAAPEDDSPPSPDSGSNTVEVGEGLENQSNPVHHFDDAVQQMADRAAAMQFSTPDDQDVQDIASQYGLDPNDVKKNLFCTATFGNFTGSNGNLSDGGDANIPDGYSEVQLDGMGGQVQHNALVPVDLAVNKVSQDLNMKPDLVRNMLSDSYGDNLGDEYHASVSGDHRYYLPQSMVQQGEQHQNQVGPTPQATQPQTPPSSMSPTQPMTVSKMIENDTRRLASRRRPYR